MTRHMNNPFKRLEGARHYSISTELFFCLIGGVSKSMLPLNESIVDIKEH